MFSSQMNPLRRLSACLSEEAGGPEVRQRRPHRHHHYHHHHRHKKDYSVSPMGGNRPFSIPGSELPTTAVSNSTTSLESTKSSESRKKSSGKHTRFSLDGDLSSSSGSSPPGGVAISGRPRRATEGSSTTIPIIKTTPPTPSPLEQARRRNTTSFGSDMGAPRVPYPVSPPAVRGDTQDYVAYPDEPGVLPPKPKEYVAYHPSSEPKPIVPPKPVKSRESHTGAVEIGSSEIIRDRSRRQRRPPRDRVKENQYDFLRTFDTVFVIDDSASMADDPPHHTRWTETRCALETIATIATMYDADGIDIHFLNSTHLDAYNVTSAAAIRSLFDRVEPRGCTPTAECLDRILRPYLDRYAASKHQLHHYQQQQPPMYSSSPESVSSTSSSLPGGRPPKPLNIVVLTDGSPTDDPESVIVSIAKQLDSLNAPLSQVGIQFFQIGDDEDAADALEELDDRLAGVYGIRDMVDYTPFYNDDDDQGGRGMKGGGEGVLKVLCGAINRRVDRWENGRRD